MYATLTLCRWCLHANPWQRLELQQVLGHLAVRQDLDNSVSSWLKTWVPDQKNWQQKQTKTLRTLLTQHVDWFLVHCGGLAVSACHATPCSGLASMHLARCCSPLLHATASGGTKQPSAVNDNAARCLGLQPIHTALHAAATYATLGTVPLTCLCFLVTGCSPCFVAPSSNACAGRVGVDR
jgi:hypothetical protein